MGKHRGDNDPKETPGSLARAYESDAEAQQREADNPIDTSDERAAADADIIDRAYGEK